MARIVIALGGNALGSTPAEQRDRVAAACPALVGLIHQGHEIIISHGNGPQVGMIQAAFDTAAKTNPKVAPMPLPECTAMSQGYIGYHLQQGMRRTLRANGMPWQVATVVTQVVVDPDDPAFGEPTKPIGAFYDEAAAQQMMRDDPSLRMREDSGRGWRRVVASPKPVDIAERRSILNLLDSEYIVIACGGGIVTRRENRDPIRQNSTVIYLRRDLELLPTSGRPVSQAIPLEELYRRRAPLYEELADLTVENRGTPEETAEEIIRRLAL